MTFIKNLEKARAEGTLPEKVYVIFRQLFETYTDSLVSHGMPTGPHEQVFLVFLERVKEQIANPFQFQSYHHKVTSPFDYYHFGLDFARPLVDPTKTRVERPYNLDRMEKQLAQGENVVLYANHQTEVDPQLFSIALEKSHPRIGAEIIFVAGDRVLTDPLAIPFSMGRNLLCIYSKRHIENPPEKKLEKQLHNQRTMKRMKELLSDGGKCIYVAPSGGRDRANEKGEVEVAPFDSQSVEMFRLMAAQATKPTHFYPLALVTFDILPPPDKVEKDLGEFRKAKREGVLFAFGDELDMEHYPGHDLPDRQARRSALSSFIWNIVNNDYLMLKNSKSKPS